MTIKFLCDYGPYKLNNTVTLTTAEETALVSAKVATTDLTGGIAYVAPDNSTYTTNVVALVAKASNKIQAILNPDNSYASIGGSMSPYIGPVTSGRGIPNHFYPGIGSLQSFNVHHVSAKTNLIRLKYMPMQAGSSGETAFTGTITQEAMVLIKGQWFRVTYNNGNNVQDYPLGAEYKSDYIQLPFYIDVDDEILELDNASLVGSSGMIVFKDTPNWPLCAPWKSTYRASTTFQPLVVTGGIPQLPTAGVVGGLTWLTTLDLNYYGCNRGCSSIEGLTTKPSVAIIGDSHNNLGAGDKSQTTIIDRYGIQGDWASICHANNIPFCNVAWSGESLTRVVSGSNFAQRALHIGDAPIIINALGFNDIGAGSQYSATWTSTTSTAVTGATFSSPPIVGQFLRDPTLLPNTSILGPITGSNGSYAFTLSQQPILASTGATVTQGTNFTLSAFRELIRQLRNLVPNGWNKRWLQDCLNQRVIVDANTGQVSASNATETLNAFNYWNKTGKLGDLINRGDGVTQTLLDGFLDSPAAVDTPARNGLLKTPSNYKVFTPGSGGNITTSIAAGGNIFRVRSETGQFSPDYDGATVLIAGAGAAGATARNLAKYVNANTMQFCTPFTYQDNMQSDMTQQWPQRTSSTTFTQVATAVSDTTMYINPPSSWKLTDGIHGSRAEKLEKIKLANKDALMNMFN